MRPCRTFPALRDRAPARRPMAGLDPVSALGRPFVHLILFREWLMMGFGVVASNGSIRTSRPDLSRDRSSFPGRVSGPTEVGPARILERPIVHHPGIHHEPRELHIPLRLHGPAGIAIFDTGSTRLDGWLFRSSR